MLFDKDSFSLYDDLEIQPNYDERHKDDVNKKSQVRRFIDNTKTSLIVSITCLLLFCVIFYFGIVPTSSMEKTILAGNHVVVHRLSYLFSEPNRGDVVVFSKNDTIMVKRAIGIPGDNIVIENGNVYVNNCLLVEKYVVGNTYSYPNQSIRMEFNVPEKSLFLLGDNREFSDDARVWDKPFVPFSDIRGKVALEISFGGDDGVYVKRIRTEFPEFLSD